MATPDPIDRIREQLAGLHPELDTAGLAVTGRILRLARHLEDARAEVLAAFDLSVADFDVLATIRRTSGDDGVKPRDLHQAVMVTSGGMTKRLDRLERAGLVARRPDPEDRRGVIVGLTPSGEELIDRALPALLEDEARRVAAAVGAQRDRDRLASLLRDLLVAAEAG